MSYHVRDFIANSTNIEKATLMIDTMELLNSVNYLDYITKLENILNTLDLYSPSDSVDLMEVILLDTLYNCCNEYDVKLDESNPEIFRLSNVYELTYALFDLFTDSDKVFIKLDAINMSDTQKLIRYLEDTVDLPLEILELLIKDVSPDLIETIEENETTTLIEGSEESFLAFKRLQKSGLSNKIVHVKEFLNKTQLGYDFYLLFNMAKELLIDVPDLNQRTLEFITLLLASNIPDDRLKIVLEDTIDEIGKEEVEVMRLRKLGIKSLMEFING